MIKFLKNLVKGRKQQCNIPIVSNSVFVGKNTGTHIFHGGCHGCTMQQEKGLGYCIGCMYFEANWNLPDLNDEHKRRNEYENEIRNIARAMANKN